MCRWAAWTGKPVFLEDLITRPEHSLIHQSRAALAPTSRINADGFGVAWYGDKPEPGLYKDVRPAWSDPNLDHLSRQVRSTLFMAHVRASTGTATSYNNCHPFAHGRWAFMHNGVVGGFDRIRKRADAAIDDDLYHARRGATDSEALFLLALGGGLGPGLDVDPIGAVARAIAWAEAMSRSLGEAPHLRFTGCWTDGERLYAARYASDDKAPTLYYRQCANGVTVVSEPLDSALAGWCETPPGMCLTVAGGVAHLTPFIPAPVPAVAAH